MDTNDFLGSFAQENVSFTTRVIKTTAVGDNYWKVMVFVESDRFVNTSDDDWTLVPGSSTIKALSVNANDYAGRTSGVLQSWLYDLFCNGFTGDCILVACAPHSEDDSSEAFITAMETAYELVKAYAYHKTVCAAPKLEIGTGSFAVDPDVAVALAGLCGTDKGLLSSAPYLPFTTATPETPDSDVLYSALNTAGKDAFMSAHQDATRNAALYSLGLAMSTLNGSGTCIGNSMDMVKSTMITCSGPSGTNLTKTVRGLLKGLNIQTFKPVGDNSGSVAAVGARTLRGDVVQATWIVAYITYMVKVAVARMITEPNYLKNASNYSDIVAVMIAYIQKFGTAGSGRLEDIQATAPAFGALPKAEDDVIIIPDAWSAKYVDQVREVQITGILYIGA